MVKGYENGIAGKIILNLHRIFDGFKKNVYLGGKVDLCVRGCTILFVISFALTKTLFETLFRGLVRNGNKRGVDNLSVRRTHSLVQPYLQNCRSLLVYT